MGVSAPAHAQDAPPDRARSNLGLCSPYLASLPAVTDPFTGDTLGGNTRSGVNLLIKRTEPCNRTSSRTPGSCTASGPTSIPSLPRRTSVCQEELMRGRHLAVATALSVCAPFGAVPAASADDVTNPSVMCGEDNTVTVLYTHPSLG